MHLGDILLMVFVPAILVKQALF